MSLPFYERFADLTWFTQQQGEYLQLEILRNRQELEELLQGPATSESIGDLVEKTNRRLNFRMNHPMFSTSCVDNSLLFSNVKKADGNLLEFLTAEVFWYVSDLRTLEGDELKLHFVFVHERRLTFHVHLCHFAVQSLKIHFRYFAQMFVLLQL